MSKLCLVTGATGYVGGRLIPRLLEAGYRVRVMVRHPERLRDLPWFNEVDVAVADAGDTEAVASAMQDVDVAYYLLHSLQLGAALETEERRLARNFANAARINKVGRIVYLGCLAPNIPLA